MFVHYFSTELIDGLINLGLWIKHENSELFIGFEKFAGCDNCGCSIGRLERI